MKRWIVLVFAFDIFGVVLLSIAFWFFGVPWRSDHPVSVQAPAPVGGQPGFAPAKGYWVEVTSVTPYMETLAIFVPPDTTQDEDVVVISRIVEEIHKNGRGVLVFICMEPPEAVFVLPNNACRFLYWFPRTKIAPTG